MDELKAELRDLAVRIDAARSELLELAVRKQSEGMRAHKMRARLARLEQAKKEWEALIREAGGQCQR